MRNLPAIAALADLTLLAACGASEERAQGGAATGPATGATVGLLGGPVGAGIGAAVGATTGAVTDSRDVNLGPPP